MDNQLIAALIGATVSGVFSLITALIPYYIQRKNRKLNLFKKLQTGVSMGLGPGILHLELF